MKVLAIILLAVSGVLSAAELEMRATPALPFANQVPNGHFDRGIEGWTAQEGNVSFAPQEGLSQKGALMLSGKTDQAVSASCVLKLKQPIAKGTPLLLRFACKKTDTDFEGDAERVILQFNDSQGKTIYLPVPRILVEDHDWARYESFLTAPDDLSNGQIILRYDRQEGQVFFDDVEFFCGKTDLHISVPEKEIKKVVLRSSVAGTILEKANVRGVFQETVSVPAFGSYCLEITDAHGQCRSCLYPSRIDANARATSCVIPLTKIRNIWLRPNKPADEFSVKAALTEGRKAYLCFDARLVLTPDATSQGGIGGFTGCLQITCNGRQLNETNMIHPSYEVTFATGHVSRMYGNGGFVMCYCTTICPLDYENSYCPVNIGDKNPFRYRLDVTPLLKTGNNIITLKNTYQTNAAYSYDVCVENARIEIQ